MSNHKSTDEVNTYNVARVGSFRSRANIDTANLRVGVKGLRQFREIYLIDKDGQNLRCVCHIETRPDENWTTTNNTRLLPVMRLLAVGAESLESRYPTNP